MPVLLLHDRQGKILRERERERGRGRVEGESESGEGGETDKPAYFRA